MLTRMKASISREVIDMSSNFTVFDIISIPQSTQLSASSYLTNIFTLLVHIYVSEKNTFEKYTLKIHLKKIMSEKYTFEKILF